MVVLMVARRQRMNYTEYGFLCMTRKCEYIVRAYDAFTTPDGHFWLELELIEGKTLQRVVDYGTITQPDQIAYITKQILQGIKFLHKNNIIHRDIKSSNIMITHDKYRVKIRTTST